MLHDVCDARHRQGIVYQRLKWFKPVVFSRQRVKSAGEKYMPLAVIVHAILCAVFCAWDGDDYSAL